MHLKPRSASGAFTRPELLALLGSVALLALLAVTTAGTTRRESQAFVCRHNLQRLANAWLVYAGDNQQLVANVHGGDAIQPRFPVTTWATGWLDWGNSPHNTNTANLQTAVFARYVGSDLSIFRCPSDTFLSPLQHRLGWTRRARTYSMNGYVGPSNLESGPFDPAYIHYQKQGDLTAPAQIFVFSEEHPDSMNDPLLFMSPAGTQFIDLLASFHNRSANFTFADGHVESHHWVSATSVQPVRYNFPLLTPKPRDPDLLWIGARTSQRK